MGPLNHKMSVPKTTRRFVNILYLIHRRNAFDFFWSYDERESDVKIKYQKKYISAKKILISLSVIGFWYSTFAGFFNKKLFWMIKQMYF